jgi:hypothetical protein
MSLIKIDSNINFLEITYPDGRKEYFNYFLTKRLLYDDVDDMVILVMADGNTKELYYKKITIPLYDDIPFSTGTALLSYLASLYGFELDEGQTSIELQNVFSSKIVEKDGLYYYPDLSGNGNDIQIKNTQIATLDGNVYLKSDYNLTLRGITVEEFIGTSTPTIDGFNITFTAGTAIYMKLSNGAEYWFQASNGIKVYDLNGITPDFIVAQDVLSTPPTQIGSDWGFEDRTTYGNDLTIKNTQVAKFNGIAFITGNFTGYTISSQEGTATATKTNDSRIDVTSGLIYSITITNGTFTLTWYAQESDFGELYFADDLGNTLIAQLDTANLEDIWSEVSSLPYPALSAKGYSKYLICKTAGTTAHLAEPDKSNLGSELVVNGMFDTDSNWIKDAGWSISGGVASCDGTNSAAIKQVIPELLGSNYKLTFDITQYVSGSITAYLPFGTFNLGNYSEDGTYTLIVIVGSLPTLDLYFKSNSFVGSIDNISVKEIQPIDLTAQENTWEFSFKLNNGSINHFVSIFTDNIDWLNGFGCYLNLRTVNGAFQLSERNGSGVLFITDNNYIDINQYYTLKIIRSTLGEFTAYIKGNKFGNDYVLVDTTGGYGTNPVIGNTHTTSKFMVIDNNAGDKVSNIKFNNESYDVSNFVDNTGSYGVQKVIAASELLDAKGNELEIPANVVSNSGNTYDGLQVTGKETDATYGDIYEIENSVNVEITKTANKQMGYVERIKIKQ